MKKLVIFDMDGTTLYTLDDLHKAVNIALETFHYPIKSLQDVRLAAGYGIDRLLQLCEPENLSKEQHQAVFTAFWTYYKDHTSDYTRPYDDIIETMKKLKSMGITLALVSNKLDQAVQELCETYFQGLLTYAVGEREGIAKKPAPDSVNEVLHKLGFTKEEAIYVGDSEVDVQTAKNANMDVVAVTWGFRDSDYLASLHPTILIHKPNELINVIKEMNMNNIFKRVSNRKYTSQPVTKEEITLLLKAAMQAPSATNQQPWEFYYTVNQEMKDKLSVSSPYAAFTAKAPLIIVPCYKKDVRLPMMCEIDLAIACENILLEAVDLDLGGCWCAIAPEKERMDAVRKILDLPNNLEPYALIAIGHPTDNHPQIDRFDTSRIHEI